MLFAFWLTPTATPRLIFQTSSNDHATRFRNPPRRFFPAILGFLDGTTRNENCWRYGEPIHAVADGEVTKVVDGIPENTPRVLPKTVTLDNIAGNYVTVRIAANRYATYAHLQNSSIRVHLHDQVHGGDVLGRLGNSGNATGPHLHFQLTDGNSVLQSEGVPFTFHKFTYLGPGSEYETDKHLSIPRDHSIPGNNDVVEFGP